MTNHLKKNRVKFFLGTFILKSQNLSSGRKRKSMCNMWRKSLFDKNLFTPISNTVM